MDGLIWIVDRCNYVKKNCKHEYKEIDYQLKIQKQKKKEKKKHGIYNPGKENPVQTFTS